MRSIALAVFMCLGLLGCGVSVRRAAQTATLGSLDALEKPPKDARLAGKLGRVLERYLDSASTAGPLPTIDKISADVARGMARGLVATAPEQQWLARHLVSESLRTAVDVVLEERDVIDRVAAGTSERIGRGLVRGIRRGARGDEGLTVANFSSEAGHGLGGAIVDEMTEALGPDSNGPLGSAMAAAAESAAKSSVRGAIAAIHEELLRCPGTPERPCLQDIVAAMSRSAARGASEGVGREIQPIPVAIAFAAGLLIALLSIRLVREWRSRKKPT